MLITAPSSVEETASITCSELCDRAIAVYSELAMRIAYCDEPDLGLGIHLASGRKTLETRAASRPWTVPPEAVRAAAIVMESVPPFEPCEPLIEWLETFPSTFLATIDRRRTLTIPMAGGRRAWDQMVRDTLIQSSGPR